MRDSEILWRGQDLYLIYYCIKNKYEGNYNKCEALNVLTISVKNIVTMKEVQLAVTECKARTYAQKHSSKLENAQAGTQTRKYTCKP